MGSSSSKKYKSNSKKGRIYLQLHAPFCYTGDTFHGTVYFVIEKPYNVESLNLILTGTEKNSWPKSKDFQNEEKVRFLEQTEVMRRFDTIVQPGHFEMPFSFGLHSTMPCSFEYENKKEKSRAFIKYAVTAILKPKSGKELRFKHKLIVRQAPPQDIQDNITKTEEDLVSACCCSKGSTKMEAILEKSVYLLSSEMKLLLKISNRECSVGIKSITAELIQRLILRDSSSQMKITENVHSSSTMPLKLCCFTNQMDFISLTLAQSEKDLQMQPSASSMLISCNYIVRIGLNYSSRFIKKQGPWVIIPVILMTGEQEFERLNPPQEWNPVIYDTYQAQIEANPPNQLNLPIFQ
jgi:hypothetical protein